MKACTTCGVEKDFSAFAADKRHKDGRQSRCRQCHRAYQKVWKARDPEHYKKLRRAEHQRRKPQAQEYQRANRARLNEGARNRLATATPDEAEKIRATHRRASAAYRARHPEACAERIREWQRRHPAKQVDAVNRRRARKMAVACEPIDVDIVGERDGWLCGICADAIDPALRYPNQQSRSVDHVIPLAMGGAHIMDNVRIAHWICNVRRGAARGEDVAAIMAKVRAA